MSERPPKLHLPRERNGGALGWLLSRLLDGGLVTLWVAIYAARELDAPGAPLVAMTVFLPQLGLALIAASFVIWTLIPDRRTPPLVLAGACVTVFVLWAPGWTANPETADGTPMKLVSWNVQRLWGDNADPKTCIAKTVGGLKPDVAVFLEISAADAQDLADRLGMRCVHTTYGAHDNHKSGGLATCARAPWSIRSSAPQRFTDEGAWQYQRSELVNHDAVVNVLAVHLTPYRATEAMLHGGWEGLWRALTDGEPVAESQGRQSRALIEHLQGLSDPTIVAGDFNSTRDAALHARLRAHLRDAWEIAGTGFGATVTVGDRVPLRVDHVYASERLAVADAVVPDTTCSDHKPVVVSFTLRPPTPTP